MKSQKSALLDGKGLNGKGLLFSQFFFTRNRILSFKICSDQGSKDFLDVHFAEDLSSKSLHCLGRDNERDSRDFLWNFPFLLLPLRMHSYLGSSLPSRSRSWPFRSMYKFYRISLGSVLKPPLASS